MDCFDRPKRENTELNEVISTARTFFKIRRDEQGLKMEIDRRLRSYNIAKPISERTRVHSLIRSNEGVHTLIETADGHAPIL
jgi:hypothetical protein